MINGSLIKHSLKSSTSTCSPGFPMSPFGPSKPGGPCNKTNTKLSYILFQSQYHLCWQTQSLKVHVVNICMAINNKSMNCGARTAGPGIPVIPWGPGAPRIASWKQKYHRRNSENVMTSLYFTVRGYNDTNHVLSKDFSEGLSLVRCFWSKICLQLTKF